MSATFNSDNVIWVLPIPSTAMVGSPSIQRLPRKEIELLFSLQQEEGDQRNFIIKYFGVESFKWTYLSSCNQEMIHLSYDKLIECSNTEWLKECQDISSRVDIQKVLRHYMMFFDDGPCFEVISQSASVVSR